MTITLQDKRSIYQIFGCLLKKPTLLGEGDKYRLENDDFPERFHKIVFAAISNLYNQGIEKIDFIAIDNFLSSYPLQHQVFSENDGIEYLQNALINSDLTNFNYYYQRIKKFSLLRTYVDRGIDITFIYDENLIDIRKKEKMQENFDKMTLQEIIDEVDKRMLGIKEKFLINYGSYGQQAGKNAAELIEDLKKTPEIGVPLCGSILNTIVRGARLKKLYMRSAPTGVGKTRLSAGDACNIACNKIWDDEFSAWVANGISEPTLFITTELEIDELQTLFLAFLSNVNEEHILNGEYLEGEEERVKEAAKILENSPLWIEHIPNYNIQEVENTIKRYALAHKVRYVFFDYIHTTIKILEEIAGQSKGMKLREDNVLLMFVTKLKDLCNEMGIFISTSTQVNADWENKATGNQNLLRGM